jgi:hypothetical protein
MTRTRLVPPLAGALVLTMVACGGGRITPPADMVGSWSGQAEIACSWCTQRDLGLAITIRPDGTVAGKIGDATISTGFLGRNTTPPAKRLGAPTKYMITAKLSGPIIASERIVRESITIPIDLAGTSLVGAFRTSGTEQGGKDKAILAGSIKALNKV